MKRYFKIIVLSNLLIIACCLVPKYSAAQIGNPGDDTDLPIDGGLSILVAAGVGYGIKKVRDERKKNSNRLS